MLWATWQTVPLLGHRIALHAGRPVGTRFPVLGVRRGLRRPAGEEPQEPLHPLETATFFAEPSAAKGSGQRQRQVRSKKNAGRRRFSRKRMHETLKIFGSATILLSVPCMTRLPCEPSARGIPDR